MLNDYHVGMSSKTLISVVIGAAAAAVVATVVLKFLGAESASAIGGGVGGAVGAAVGMRSTSSRD